MTHQNCFLLHLAAASTAVAVLACAQRPPQDSLYPGRRSAAPDCTGLLSDDSTVYDTIQVAIAPQLRNGPRLHYPVLALQRMIQGRVLVAVIVNADGNLEPDSTNVVKSADAILNGEAIRYLSAARFWPGCRDGLAVRVRTLVPIDFKMTTR